MADWGGRKWWLIRSPRLTFSIASFLLNKMGQQVILLTINHWSLDESYLVGSRYLLLISTGSTCFNFKRSDFLEQNSVLVWLLCCSIYLGRFKLGATSMACAGSTLSHSVRKARLIASEMWKQFKEDNQTLPDALSLYHILIMFRHLETKFPPWLVLG